MDTTSPLLTVSFLSKEQKALLKKGNFETIGELLLAAPSEVASKCKMPPIEAQRVLYLVYNAYTPSFYVCQLGPNQEGGTFTTGDMHLDRAIGGGLRTGMVWEIVGESAAGKTQFALQMALLVQIPPNHHGLSGSTCYLTTSATLPTTRLVQISQTHPALSPELCSLADIQTVSTATIPILLNVLTHLLPKFVSDRAKNPAHKPVRLIVIDALGELFHQSNKTTTMTLVERSRNITEISSHLHTLAQKYDIAILVLNEVVDVFDKGDFNVDVAESADIIYRDQARWFNRADSIPGENRKEASLGLVWANQVNTRIILTRTGRRRYLEDELRHLKQNQPDRAHAQGEPVLIRRLSVIFSSICSPVSFDYIVSKAGITILPDSEDSSMLTNHTSVIHPPPTQEPLTLPMASQVSPLDVGVSQDNQLSNTAAEQHDEDDDEWESYWKQDDASSIPTELYS